MKKVKKGLQDIGIMEIVETSRTWCTVGCIYRHPLAASNVDLMKLWKGKCFILEFFKIHFKIARVNKRTFQQIFTDCI